MSDTSRRYFLKATALTAGILVAPPLRAAALGAFSEETGPVPAEVLGAALDGGWQFRRGPRSGIWDVWHAAEDEDWGPVALPHCFNARDACDPEVAYFRGQGWYRTQLAIDNPFQNGRTLLHFRGSGQTTTLWVGDTRVGEHVGGYDEFAFDITEAVARGAKDDKRRVRVAICCDNSPDVNRVPSDQSDFCLFGGLYRHVSLVYLPAVSLDTVHVLPTIAADGSAEVVVKARLYAAGVMSGKCTVSLEVVDRDGTVVHKSSRDQAVWTGWGELTKFIVAKPKRWSPEDPHLYRCTVTVSSTSGQTSLVERFGVRDYEFVEHGPFKLNGKRVLLNGTQRHQDHAGVAAGMTDEQVRTEMRMIREMGANFIRLGHYQQDRLVLELCDELGLMVWEEVPWCRAGIGSEAFQANAKAMLTHMIEQHFNHPSIILWGLGNEDDWPDEYPSIDQQAIRGFMTTLRDLAHGLDGSRLTAFRRCDFARDIPDVYSPSIWAGWYRGNYHEYEQTLATERERVKRFIHIEWGADSHAGRYAEDPEAALRKVKTGNGTDERGMDFMKTGGDARVSKDGDWSETYACRLFDWHLKTQEKLEWLTGSAQWIFKDFASPQRTVNDIPNVNEKGLVTRDLEKKEGYFVFQSYWAAVPMVRIHGHRWPVRWGKAGEARDVLVYSNCEQAELFLNGVSQGTKVRDSQDFPAAGLRWKVAFKPGRNHLRASATKHGVTIVDEVDHEYQVEAWSKPTELRLREVKRANDVVTVEAQVFDANGIACLDARTVVHFAVIGDARLIDNQGTTRGSRELQTYNGRAEISLSRKGKCSVGVTSVGLPPAFLNVL